MNRYINSSTFFMIGLLIGIGSMLIDEYLNKQKQPEIKPCNCLTLRETLFHVEKVEMFVDKLQRVKKGQRNAIIDSINYHNTLLKREGNIIEY